MTTAQAQADLQRLQTAASQGFISRRDLETREGALLARQQQLLQLQQSRSAKAAARAEAQRLIAQLSATAQAESASVLSSRAEVAARVAETGAGRGYVMTSQIAGTVTAITGRVGQAASPQQPIMMVVPDGATPRAELHVPSSAIGFLRTGQEVRLSVDAFPAERFGTVGARIAEISSVPTAQQRGDGSAVPVYLVTVDIPEPWVTAYGRRHPFLSGMALSARVVTVRQSLLEWLFEPLFSEGAR